MKKQEYYMVMGKYQFKGTKRNFDKIVYGLKEAPTRKEGNKNYVILTDVLFDGDEIAIENYLKNNLVM